MTTLEHDCSYSNQTMWFSYFIQKDIFCLPMHLNLLNKMDFPELILASFIAWILVAEQRCYDIKCYLARLPTKLST